MELAIRQGDPIAWEHRDTAEIPDITLDRASQ
jgi:hypothetical protein